MVESQLRIERYADPPALLRGITALFKQGTTARGLLFLALDPHGVIHLCLPSGEVPSTLRVGEKFTLAAPTGERLYHYDSIHFLRDDFYLFNGDRRLTHPGDAVETTLVMVNFLRWCKVTNVFFGCTPHQPGSWLVGGKQVVALHDLGIHEVLPMPTGLLGRRTLDDRLYLLTYQDIARTGHLEDWLPVFTSPLGNILLLERRVVRNRLVLSCERGLVEVDLSGLPKVQKTAELKVASGPGPFYAVVGRVDGEAFAVTQGTPREWGLEDLAPAELIFTPAGQLSEMQKFLQRG